MRMIEELYDCPFCGAEWDDGYGSIDISWASQYDSKGYPIKGTTTYAIICKECGGQSGWFDSRALAIARWNRRPRGYVW